MPCTFVCYQVSHLCMVRGDRRTQFLLGTITFVTSPHNCGAGPLCSTHPTPSSSTPTNVSWCCLVKFMLPAASTAWVWQLFWFQNKSCNKLFGLDVIDWWRMLFIRKPRHSFQELNFKIEDDFKTDCCQGWRQRLHAQLV